MSAGKWIGGIIGWITAGPLGALAGVAIGALFDTGLDSVNNPGNSGTRSGAFGNSYDTAREYNADKQRKQSHTEYLSERDRPSHQQKRRHRHHSS